MVKRPPHIGKGNGSSLDLGRPSHPFDSIRSRATGSVAYRRTSPSSSVHDHISWSFTPLPASRSTQGPLYTLGPTDLPRASKLGMSSFPDSLPDQSRYSAPSQSLRPGTVGRVHLGRAWPVSGCMKRDLKRHGSCQSPYLEGGVSGGISKVKVVDFSLVWRASFFTFWAIFTRFGQFWSIFGVHFSIFHHF
jgi:hypothetical protein